ncbi:MAG TPA: carboxypeptidase-like regulatory domain-containing protein [Bryobacteraceae bacterium]|nr:carboxypeptidase-like regulatory domain-containing protein [Bryobacteraceae bacterium]
MWNLKLASIFSLCAALSPAFAQQTNPNDNNKPSIILENKEKPPKPSDARTISGFVKDRNENPISGAIVQLKDMKTSKVIDFATQDDGRFIFKDLHMDIDYQLTAKHDGEAPVTKKVSTYDTRKNVVLTFRLEPPSKEAAQ